MKARTIVITFTLLGVTLVIAAYVQRGEFGIGSEWALPIIAAAVVPLEEGEKDEK